MFYGIIKPKIYLTPYLSKDEKKYILAHEKTHIKRKDYITKTIAYTLLSIHILNPFNFILFKLFVNDMEMLCDEEAMKKLGIENKDGYMESLVNLSAKNRKIAPCPIAFSENNTEKRVKNMINYKKSGIAISVIAIIICVIIAAFCISDRKENINNNNNESENEEYSKVLDKLKNLITSNEEFESKAQAYQDNGFAALYRFEDNKSLDNFRYAKLDINNDGQDELLLYVPSAYNNVIFDLYTIVNEEIVHVFSSFERVRYILCENGFIKEEFSNSASESGVNYYKLSENGSLVLVEGILNTSLPALGSTYMGYVYTNGSGEESYINDEESSAIEAKYKELSVNKEFLFGEENYIEALNQIDVIMANKGLWLEKEEYGDVYSYAITDLNQNGRFEIIASICQGTGIYTTTKIYELDEAKKGLNKIEYPIEDGKSMADIINRTFVCFYDKTNNIYHYILNDLIKNGPSEYYSNKRDFYIKDGKVNETFLAYKEEIYGDGPKTVKYTDSNGNEITEDEYNDIENKIFKDLERKTANISWSFYNDSQKTSFLTLSEEEIRNILIKSYLEFYCV